MATTDNQRAPGAKPEAQPPPPDKDQPKRKARPLWQRLGWFVLLWAAGAGVLWLISLLIRWAVVPE